MKSVLISINPKWVAKIANGEKTVEVRKSYPHCELPFKAYIYCTNAGRPLVYGDVFRGNWHEEYVQTYGYSRKEAEKIWDVMNGKVVGEFVCNGIDEFIPSEKGIVIDRFLSLHETCLKVSEMRDYLKGKKGYGWRISDLKIYDEPKELSEFYTICNGDCLDTRKKVKCEKLEEFIENKYCRCYKELKRPPQSWQFAEEKQND